MEPKRRKISTKDWDAVQSYIETELESRKNNTFRKGQEAIWKEVDRQVAMQPMRRIVNNKDVEDWHSTVELGELSKASEIITADVRRMLFPHSRAWFDPHIEMQQADASIQKNADGALRAFMGQQHIDFGLKSRVELSLKEALHHGSFVAEASWETRLKVSDGSKVENIAAPVWIPHSMWNCYPDSSPSVIGTDIFYSGTMMIVSYMPMHKVRDMAVGEGWMNIDKIPSKKQDQDVELITYFGDLVIPRNDGEIYLPNCKAITANKKIIYYKPLDLPYLPIIYAGYERQDVRSPYYTSPIVKLSPMQKLGSVMANKFIESIAMRVEPPIIYDGNDPYFVQNGGPVIAPGARNATKGSAEWKLLDIGDPMAASAGLELAIRQIQEGTGVNAVRAGGLSSDRKTATEISQTSQAGEVRTVDFVDKVESQALRPFLYMQHALNKLHMKDYSFYNSEMDSPDFMRARRDDLPDVVHFEVVGSKGLLGEEQRTQRTSAVTAFASGNPLFAGLLKPAELLKEMYQDAGNKNPERFLNVQDGQDPRMQQMAQQAQQAVQALQQKIQELESKQQVEMQKLQVTQQSKQAELQLKQAEMQQKAAMSQAELQQKAQIAEAELLLKQQVAEAELSLKQQAASGDISSRERIELAKLGIQAQEDEVQPTSQIVDAIREMNPAQSMQDAMAMYQDAQNQQLQVLLQGLQQIVEQLNRPKRLVRDSEGRPAGVEVV